MQITFAYQHSKSTKGLLGYTGLCNHDKDQPVLWIMEKISEIHNIFLKIHNIFIFIAPTCICFFFISPAHLRFRLSSQSKKMRLALILFYCPNLEIRPGDSQKLICIDQSRFCISYPQENTRMLNMTIKYFNIFNNTPHACWVPH